MKKGKKLTQKEAIDEMKNLLQRTQADFINYKRRTEEERFHFLKTAHSDILAQTLPVLDNFSRAAQHTPVEIAENNWVIGIQAIEKQLEQILEANGLTKIKTVGEDFNPNFHEAI